MSTPRTHVSLDGNWTLAYDPEDRGLAEKWFETPPSDRAGTVHFPTMQSQGIEKNGGVGWYFKTFDFDSAWQGRFVTFQLAAAGYPIQVWLNNTRLGDHPGGGTAASFPITAQLRPGANQLAIRLAVFEAGRETAGEPDPRFPLDSLAAPSIATMPKAHIENIFIQPDVRRKRVVATVEAPDGCEVLVQIEGTPYQMRGTAGELVLEFPEFVPWTVESPQRYTLRAHLTAGDGSQDSVSVTFGMREFTVKDERFYLNNRPFYVKAVTYQAQYPQSLVAEKLPLLLKRELNLARDAGFNTIRIASGPAPAHLLELAGELGMLVFQELPQHDGASAAGRWRAVAEAMVTRDRNETALAAWCGLEFPGDGNTDAGTVRALDPSRLILCDAPGASTQMLLRPYRDAPEPYESFATAITPPVHQMARDYLRLAGDPERLNVQTALTAGGAAQWDDGTPSGQARQEAFEAAFAQRQLERCFGGLEAFYEASQQRQASELRAQLDAVRSNVKMMGYCVCHLADGPGASPFGLADRKRQAKLVLKSLKRVQQEVRPVIQMYKTNLAPREEVGVTILLINESRLEGRGELSLQVVGPTNQVLWKKKRLVKIPRHGRELWTGDIAASGSPGPHRFVVRLIQDRRVIGENSVNLHVVQPQKADQVEINVLGGRGPVRTACGRLAKLHNFLAPIHIVPPMGNTIRAYPADDLLQIMAQVAEGAIAIVFSPPGDWNELAEMIDPGLSVKSRSVSGPGALTHHYAKLHPVFDGLPSRDLMLQPYQNILPLETFESDSDEEMSGVHCFQPASRQGEAPSQRWGANLIVRRLGGGRVVFTHLRVLEHLGTDPVADRLFVNLLNHFSRRSVPATEAMAADQKAVEWINQERNNTLRKWMLLGSFANWNGLSGHRAVFPPEKAIDFAATYPGWYRALYWKTWWTRDVGRHTIDFHAALDADAGTGEACRYATAFAYAEFNCDRRQEIAVNVEGAHAVKAWLNGIPIGDSVPEGGAGRDHTALGWVKQGKNTLLIKCSKGPGPYTLGVNIEPAGSGPLLINWWK